MLLSALGKHTVSGSARVHVLVLVHMIPGHAKRMEFYGGMPPQCCTTYGKLCRFCSVGAKALLHLSNELLVVGTRREDHHTDLTDGS